MKFLAKITILDKNRSCGITSQFQSENKFLVKNRKFWPKWEFWSKIEIVENDRNFSAKKKILTKKQFLVKISQIGAAKVRGTRPWF